MPLNAINAMTLLLSIIINVFLVILWYKQKKYTKALFKRSWRLELCLLDIYDSSPFPVRKKIENAIKEVVPL